MSLFVCAGRSQILTVECSIVNSQDVRDKLLKQTFAVGTTVIFIASVDRRTSGLYIPPFSKGKVTGPSPNDPGSVNVRFAADELNENTKSEFIVAQKTKLAIDGRAFPQVAAPCWWLKPGMAIKFTGKGEVFKNGKGSISTGQIGFILGAAESVDRVRAWTPRCENSNILLVQIVPAQQSDVKNLTDSVSVILNLSLKQWLRVCELTVG